MPAPVGFTDAPSKAESQKLTTLGTELFQTDVKIKQLEAALEEAKATRLDLVMHKLPEYMDEIGQDRVGLEKFNVDLEMADYYHANIAADWEPEKREKAFKWLEDNGHGDMIKTIVTIQFSRRLLNHAKAVVEKLSKMKIKGFGAVPEPEIGMAVPWNTLTAFVREQTEKSVALPLDTLGATVGRIVKIKARK